MSENNETAVGNRPGEDVFARIRREAREKQEREAEQRRRFDVLTGRKEKEDDELDKRFSR